MKWHSNLPTRTDVDALPRTIRRVLSATANVLRGDANAALRAKKTRRVVGTDRARGVIQCGSRPSGVLGVSRTSYGLSRGGAQTIGRDGKNARITHHALATQVSPNRAYRIWSIVQS